MDIFQIYANGKYEDFRETLTAAQDAGASFAQRGADVRIEHPRAPAPTSIWRYDAQVSHWVRTN